jgi:hypothetical protein
VVEGAYHLIYRNLIADDTDLLAVVIFERASNPIPKEDILPLDVVAASRYVDGGRRQVASLWLCLSGGDNMRGLSSRSSQHLTSRY